MKSDKKLLGIVAAIVAVLFSCIAKPSQPKADTLKTDTLETTPVTKQQDAVVPRNSVVTPGIEGTYVSKPLEEGGETCDLTLQIGKVNAQLVYTLSLKNTVMKGKITVTQSDEPERYTYRVKLEGIKWAEYEGDISDEDKPQEELEIPVGIEAEFLNNELVFQNYGNSMNSYMVLAQCGQKYIRLVKR